MYSDTIFLDTTPPTATLHSPTEGQVLDSSSVTAAWTGADIGSGIDHYEIRLNTENWINKGTSNNHTFTGLSDGNHLISLNVIDKAGNLKEIKRNFSVQIVPRKLTVASSYGN